MKYKVCRNCGYKNPVEEFICLKCMADISTADIVEEKQATETKYEESNLSIEDEYKTSVELSEKLILKHEKFSIEVFPGDVVGRHAKGKQYLKNYPTVSRIHAKFYKEADGWYVEDLNSTNGTYANDKRITKKTKIENGDIIKLSLSIAFKVVIEKH
ncbi:MAG: FHA domain-containing protein [Thermocrinis sp.]|jgi:ribosomal protein L40E|uniref:FHA domain-containing protein n=1 Tax=Thermocrinis sp. TaxID=2024383 RepID=UPI003BFD4E7F